MKKGEMSAMESRAGPSPDGTRPCRPQCDVCALFQMQRVLSKGVLCSLVSIGGFLHLYGMLPTKSN